MPPVSERDNESRTLPICTPTCIHVRSRPAFSESERGTFPCLSLAPPTVQASTSRLVLKSVLTKSNFINQTTESRAAWILHTCAPPGVPPRCLTSLEPLQGCTKGRVLRAFHQEAEHQVNTRDPMELWAICCATAEISSTRGQFIHPHLRW